MKISSFSFRAKPLIALICVGTIAIMFAMTGCKNGDKTKAGGEEKAAAAAADGDKAEVKLPLEATGPVAIIDGEEISAEKFNKTASRRMGNMSSAIPPQLVTFFQEKLLDMVIDEYLIDRKIANANLDIPKEEIDKTFDAFKVRFPSVDEYNSFLKENGLDEAEIKEDIRKDLSLRQIMTKEANIDLSDATLKTEYDSHIDEFKQDNQVRASHILLSVSKDADQAAVDAAKKKAEEIAAKAKAPGADFAALAKAESSCPSSANGGDLNFFAAEMMVPEFSNAAFAMKVGEISDPVRSQFGFHIIKLTDRKEAHTMSFDEAKVIIKRKLEEEKMQSAFDSLMTNLKKDVKIEKLEKNIRVNEMPVDPALMIDGMEAPNSSEEATPAE